MDSKPQVEREYIRSLEMASPDEFVQMLRAPSAQEEQILRSYLGDERYRRMHAAALQNRVRRAPHGNVVVLHGILGGELTTFHAGTLEPVWLRVFRLATGALAKLRLEADGRTDADHQLQVHASGILKKYYGELILSLSRNWTVRTFWYDWRKSLEVAAADLSARIEGWFGSAPVHLVAHSMGGLVARTFIAQNGKRWQEWGRTPNGSRLIMLGTPNYGSFAIPQIFTGIEQTIAMLARLDLRHSKEEIVEIVNSFPGLYQMLPSPAKNRDWERFYQSSSWGVTNVAQDHLDYALRHHEVLAGIIDGARMLYVAGTGVPTFSGV